MASVFEEPTGQYHLVFETDTQKFESKVSVLIARGWLCVGGVVFQHHVKVQAMAKVPCAPISPGAANVTEMESMTAALGKAYAEIASLKALLAERDNTIQSAAQAAAAETAARRAERLSEIAELQRELEQDT